MLFRQPHHRLSADRPKMRLCLGCALAVRTSRLRITNYHNFCHVAAAAYLLGRQSFKYAYTCEMRAQNRLTYASFVECSWIFLYSRLHPPVRSHSGSRFTIQTEPPLCSLAVWDSILPNAWIRTLERLLLDKIRYVCRIPRASEIENIRFSRSFVASTGGASG